MFFFLFKKLALLLKVLIFILLSYVFFIIFKTGVEFYFYDIERNKNNEHLKISFINKIDEFLLKKTYIEVELKNLVDFKWKQVCFDYAKPTMTFYKIPNLQEVIILPEEKFYIERDDIDGSPSEMCFNNKQIFIFQLQKNHSKKILIKYRKENK